MRFFRAIWDFINSPEYNLIAVGFFFASALWCALDHYFSYLFWFSLAFLFYNWVSYVKADS